MAERPSGSFGIAAIALYAVLMNPIRAVRFHALAAGLFGKAAARAARRTVPADVRSRAGSCAKGRHAEDVLPYRLRFKPAATDSVEPYAEKGGAAVDVDCRKDGGMDFANAMREYADGSVLPGARHGIPSKVLAAA